MPPHNLAGRRTWSWSLPAVCLLAFWLAPTQVAEAAVHRVRRGESIYSIARRYRVPVRRVAVANRLRRPYRVRTGQRLIIPTARRRIRRSPRRPRRSTRRPRRAAPAPRRPASASRPPTTSPSRESTRRLSRSKSMGNSKLSAVMTRSMLARASSSRLSNEATTTVTVKVLGRSLRAFRTRRRVGCTAPRSSRPRLFRSNEVELIGLGRLSVNLELSRSFPVFHVEVPVPILWFTVTIEGDLGASLSLSANVPVGFRRGSASYTLSGSVGMAASLGVGAGIPGARVGVEGVLDLIKASLPFTTTLRASSVRYDVALVVESSASINLFAKAGWGPFSKKASVTVFKWTLWETRLPLGRATLVAR